MSGRTNVLSLCGSLRAGSVNEAVLRTAARADGLAEDVSARAAIGAALGALVTERQRARAESAPTQSRRADPASGTGCSIDGPT